MQTIARANRVFRDKVNGLIVDYVGVFRNLQKALAIYAAPAPGGGADTPVKDKAELVEQLRKAIAEAEAFCAERGVDPATIQAAQGFERVRLLDDAVEAIVVNDEVEAQVPGCSPATSPRSTRRSCPIRRPASSRPSACCSR